MLPSNFDDSNDIGRIGEFYFKKFETDEPNELDTGEPENVPQTTEPYPSAIAKGRADAIDDSASKNIFASEDGKNNLREMRSTSGYQDINESLLNHTFESRKINLIPTDSRRADADDAERIFDDDDDYSSEEDYAEETSGGKVARKNSIRLHTSYQKSSIREPLLQQGFIASPGYPSFYIGSSNCSWTLTAPSDQRIRLTILDLNLRCELFSCSAISSPSLLKTSTDDQPCVDQLEIRDVINEEVIFSSCTEMSNPFEVLSYSSELKVRI